jgi:hypothetical protein
MCSTCLKYVKVTVEAGEEVEEGAEAVEAAVEEVGVDGAEVTGGDVGVGGAADAVG